MSLGLAVSTDFAESTPRKQSLQEELAEHGVPVLEPAIASAHMKKSIRDSRVGIYRFAGPLLQAFSTASYWLSRPMSFIVFMVSLVVLFVSFFEFSPEYILGVITPSALAISLVVALVVLAAGMVLVNVFGDVRSPYHNRSFSAAASIWMREVFDKVDRSTLLKYNVPNRLVERTLQANKIDDIVVSRVIFGVDPFIEVSRKRWFGTERAIIGGYHTGNTYIDNF